MDLDEFLSENGIPLGEGALGRSPPTKGISPSRSVASSDGSSGSGLVRGSLALNCNDSSGDSPKPGSSASNHYPESPVNYQRLGFILIIASFVVIIIILVESEVRRMNPKMTSAATHRIRRPPP